MSLLERIKAALSSAGIKAEEANYPFSIMESCARIMLTGKTSPISLKSGKEIPVETFKVAIRSDDCHSLIEKVDLIEAAFKKAGFIQIGEYEDIDSEADGAFVQLALNYKVIETNLTKTNFKGEKK